MLFGKKNSMAANPKPVEGSMPKTHLTPTSQSAPKPQPQGPPSVSTRPMHPILPKTNKRKLIDTTFSNPNSSYFKIRALTQQLRPHFIEVHYTTCQKHLLYQYLYACLSVFLNNVGPILGGSMLLFCRAEKLGSRKNLFVFRKQAKFKP